MIHWKFYAAGLLTCSNGVMTLFWGLNSDFLLYFTKRSKSLYTNYIHFDSFQCDEVVTIHIVNSIKIITLQNKFFKNFKSKKNAFVKEQDGQNIWTVNPLVLFLFNQFYVRLLDQLNFFKPDMLNLLMK